MVTLCQGDYDAQPHVYGTPGNHTVWLPPLCLFLFDFSLLAVFPTTGYLSIYIFLCITIISRLSVD